MPFSTLITNTGLTKIANAIATSTPLPLLQMAVGDGNGNPITPNASMTALVRQRFIGPIAQAKVDPNDATQMIFDLQVPATEGGWAIHEVGLFDNTGSLIAIASFPATYKPLPSEGSTSDLTVRIYAKISDASAVTVTVDPAIVLASQSWVIANFGLAALIPGGTTDQLLVKKSNTPGDVEWRDPLAVQVIVDVRKEQQTLTAGQTVVDLAVCTTVGLAVYIEGSREEDWTVTSTTRITLGSSYPTGTKIYFFQNDPTNQADLLTRNGGTMKTGAGIAFDGGTASGIPNPTAADHAANKAYVDTVLAGGKLVGEVFMHAGVPASGGGVEYIECDGRALDRTTYATLFTALGGASSPWGLPNGAQFNIPDLRGRAPVGAGVGTGLTSRAVGAKGGAERHTLTVAEMPSHSHTQPTTGSAQAGSDNGGAPVSSVTGYSTARTQSNTGDTGGGNSHNNMQPFTVIQFWVRAK
ncbi:MAG: hypothetical protein RLZZ127_1562 [Planctomycetota bacterium]|jgi:microcystin-dependent protein